MKPEEFQEQVNAMAAKLQQAMTDIVELCDLMRLENPFEKQAVRQVSQAQPSQAPAANVSQPVTPDASQLVANVDISHLANLSDTQQVAAKQQVEKIQDSTQAASSLAQNFDVDQLLANANKKLEQ